MKAIGIRNGKGDASALFVDEVVKPKPGPGEILIKVAAAGVNRPDIAQREGNYPPPPGASPVMGLEVAGTVEQVGSGDCRWCIGDRVAALLPGGGYAEYAVVDARHALPVPASLPFEQAGALPETVFTVFTNLFERGRLAAGDRVLIHGGNSGIGTTAIVMAKRAGATVTATVRGAAKAEAARNLGADQVIDVTSEDWVEAVNKAGGVNVVLDMIGGDYFAGNVAVLQPDGRLVQIATLAGNVVQTDLLTFMFKRLTLTASTLRGRPADEKARLTAAVAENVWPWFAEQGLRLPLDRTFPLEKAGEAHRWLEDGAQFGKVVLVP